MTPEVREAREVLERTPELLDGWLRGLSEPWLSATEGEGTYSPRDVVAHLVDNEEVDWIPRLRIIVEHGESRPFTPFDREGFRARFAGLGIDSLLDAFADRRRESLEALATLDLKSADLARTGLHPTLGRVTARQLLASWTVHDLTHVAQVARVMAKRWTAETGPWREFLGVLSERVRPLLPALLVVALLPIAAFAAPSAKLFLVERVPGGVALRADSVAAGAVAEFPIDPDSGLVDLVLPVGPGQSASLLRPSDRGSMLVVRHRGDTLYASVRRPDGSMHERQPRSLADLAREETRLSVTGGDGTRAAYVIRGGAEAKPDTAGPAANMFAGKLPFKLGDGDWVVETETWRRPLSAAPRGRMVLSRESYLFAEVVRPDGRLGRFIVDLGAGESIVAPGFVPKGQAVIPSNMVEYSLRGARLLDYRAGDATGVMPVIAGHTVFPSLSLGGVTVDLLEAQVAELPAALGEGVVGILGIDVLRRAGRVRLTLPAKAGAPAVLEFDPPAPLAREAGRCAFSWLSSHVVLGGEVSGRPAHWIVDSGSPVSFMDPTRLAEAPWVLAARQAPPVRGVGGRPGVSYDAIAPSLRVGTGARWADVPVRLARLAPFDAVRPGGRVPALLGVSELVRMGSFELDFNARLARWGSTKP